MTLVRLHRRLAVGMAATALLAFGAGAGLASPWVLAGGSALLLAMVWQPSAAPGLWLARMGHALALALAAWAGYVAFGTGGDILPPLLTLLVALLATEALRPLGVPNDMRLYALSFALLIAATAYYPGPLFAAAFVGYVTLGTLALMTGHLRRQAERFGTGDVPLGRRFLTATALLSAVTLVMSAGVFLLFPRLPRAWSLHGRSGAGQTMAGFGNEVSLGEYGSRIASNDRVMFRVEFPDRKPPRPEEQYWRGRSYDRFEGVRWERTRAPAPAPPPVWYRARWGDTVREQRIYGGPPGADVLFGLHPVLEVDPRSAIRAFRAPSGDIRFWGSDTPVYTVFSGPSRPTEMELRASLPGSGPGDAYLQLPPLSPRVARLADSLTANRTTRLAQVRAVRDYLRGFRYTLDLPTTPREATLEGFLFRRHAGHCEYFSTALAVLLRTRGIPTRNVNGFLGGEWNPHGGYLAVTGNQAHSWTEVWFPGLGWVPFDATPPAERDAAVAAARGWGRWPGAAWLDGLQHRWYTWVLDYNLDKQLGLFQSVRQGLLPRGPGARRTDWRAAGAGLLPWLAALAAAAVLLALLARWRLRGTIPTEARDYLALRRRYARAGYAADPALPPLFWLDTLRREDAPGREAAERVVRLYARARWAGEPLDGAQTDALRTAAAEARAALRGEPRRSPAHAAAPEPVP